MCAFQLQVPPISPQVIFYFQNNIGNSQQDINNFLIDHLILQEYMPGDDTHIHVLYVYVGKDKKVKGNILLEDPPAHHIGTPLGLRIVSPIKSKKWHKEDS